MTAQTDQGFINFGSLDVNTATSGLQLLSDTVMNTALGE